MPAAQIDPQVRAALARRRFSLPHTRYGLKVLRVVARLASKYGDRTPPAVGFATDLTVPTPGGGRPARRYLPAGEGPVPTIVYFHGGGFVLGGLETHDRLCRLLTRESRCAVLSVAYRLAPENPFPAAVEDAYAAVEWAAANVDAVGGGKGLAVAGDSAGGTLAAVCALMAADRDGPGIDHQTLLYPAIGIDAEQESVQQHAGTVLDEADLRFVRDCYLGSDVHERNPYADPSEACDLSGVAPATVVTAGFDPLRDGGLAYADQLQADDVEVRSVTYEAMVHGFATMRGVDRAREAIGDLGAELQAATSE